MVFRIPARELRVQSSRCELAFASLTLVRNAPHYYVGNVIEPPPCVVPGSEPAAGTLNAR